MVIIKHRGNYTLVALFGAFFSILLGLIILLWYEYCFFHQQAKELIVLRSEYRAYIHAIKMYEHKFDASVVEQGGQQNKTQLENATLACELYENTQEEDSFEYLKSQELDLLLTQIDTKEWQDYNDQVLTQATDPRQEVIKTQTQPQASQNKPSRSDNNLITKLNEKNINLLDSFQSKNITNVVNRDCKLDFIWPIQQSRFWLSSLFGPRKKRNGSCGFHSGIDMAALKGTPIKAAQAGEVIEARYASGYGNTVVLKHSETYTTRYAHLYMFRVHVGQKIKQGMIIGAVGDTGFIRKKGKDGSHLHFEVCENGKKINPLHCLTMMS